MQQQASPNSTMDTSPPSSHHPSSMTTTTTTPTPQTPHSSTDVFRVKQEETSPVSAYGPGEGGGGWEGGHGGGESCKGQGGGGMGSDDDRPDWEKERPWRRKRRIKGQKICCVCGDLAQSHNFGALTCETCKAFFRRNAFKHTGPQKCVFNGSCIITKSTRRFCAPCRLKKCYSVGMDPELILDEDEKKARQTKRERETTKRERETTKRERETTKREPKHQQQQHQHQHPPPSSYNPFDVSTTTALSPASSSPSMTPSVSSNPAASPGSSDSPAMHDSAMSAQSAASSSSSSSSAAAASTSSHSLPSNLANYPEKGRWKRPQNALGRRFKHVARDELPWDMQLFWPLDASERGMLAELTSSYQTVTASMSPDDLDKARLCEGVNIEKAIYLLEYHMRQYVQFARNVSEFQQLRQGDQIALLKASALQWYHVRVAQDYIPERRAWVNAFGTVQVTELGAFLGEATDVQEYAEFCESLKFVVKNDTTLYALIHVLMLFDPRDSLVENRVQVNCVKDRYLVLLKHHLESQFSFLHADRYLSEILQQILDLRMLGESSLVFYKHFSSQFRPLIAEVFSS